MAKGEIIAIRDVAMELARPTEASHKEITYKIDGLGPYVVYMPMAEFTPERVLDLIRTRVKEWTLIVGKSIEVK